MPSPIVWPAKSWNGWLALAVVVGALFVLIVPTAIYGVAEIAAGRFDPTQPFAPKYLNVALTSQVITYFPLALFFAAVLPPLSGVSLSTLGFVRPTLRTLTIAALGCVAMFVLVSASSVIVVGITHRQDTETAIELLKSLRTQGQIFNFVLVAVVLAPLVEELVFRVFLFNFLTRYTNVWVAMALSGTIFGMVHAAGSKDFASQLITVGIPLSLGGITLAYVYSVTKNYWASVTTHVIFNLIGVVSVLYFHGS